MNTHGWIRTLALAALFLASVAAPASAQFPTLKKRVEADPQNPYTLTREATADAPWMIMAASFKEGGQLQAHALVLEIRRKLNLEAWMHEMSFDFTGGAKAKTVDRFGNNQAKYARGGIKTEYAVLVGRFAGADDPRVALALKTIKQADFDCLAIVAGRPDYMSLGGLRMQQRAAKLRSGSEEELKKGPLSHAFVATNPTFPEEYYQQSGVDPLVVKLNANVQFSLLRAPGRYTVQIASFSGKVLIDPKKVAALGSSQDKGLGNRLVEAAEKANKLTLALRAKGVEAYEFHDVSMSMVTVGSFNDVGQRRADGKTELYPQIVQIMNTYGATDITTGKLGMPKEIIRGIQCDVQPQIVEVPKPKVINAADRERFRQGLLR